jgi:hypothetical protein
MSFQFDSNLEPMFDVSGPGAEMLASGAQAQPGAFTTVGGESIIPSGLTGSFLWGGTVYQIEKMQIDIDNAMDVQNTALGTSKAAAYFRKGKRMVTVKVNAKVSDDLTLWTPSLTAGQGTMFIQIGTTATRMWAAYIPVAQIMAPADVPDNDETNNWDFTFQALGVLGNDELYLAQA